MTSLRLLLEYSSNNGFIDTIGFGLKNNENKTPIELAILGYLLIKSLWIKW